MYYVYGHKEKGKDEYVYIGSGKNRRAYTTWRKSDEHTEFMKSENFIVDIISKHKSKEEAFFYEKHHIEMHIPKFNTMTYHGRSNKKTSELTLIEVGLRKKERIAHYQRLKNT